MKISVWFFEERDGYTFNHIKIFEMNKDYMVLTVEESGENSKIIISSDLISKVRFESED